jgi:hypothetical protein
MISVAAARGPEVTMRARLAVLLVALAAPAAALEPDAAGETGLVLGARVGWGRAFGELAHDAVAVRDVVEAKLPIWLEVGYRFGPRFHGELYFELAPGSVRSEFCTSGVSCSATDVRFGIALQLHLAPRALLDPWIAVGVGIEVLKAQLSDADPLVPPGRNELTWTGFELPLVEAGIDVRISRRFSLGPYVSGSFGQFTSLTVEPNGGASTSAEVDDRGNHGWIQVGLKSTLRL